MTTVFLNDDLELIINDDLALMASEDVCCCDPPTDIVACDVEPTSLEFLFQLAGFPDATVYVTGGDDSIIFPACDAASVCRWQMLTGEGFSICGNNYTGAQFMFNETTNDVLFSTAFFGNLFVWKKTSATPPAFPVEFGEDDICFWPFVGVDPCRALAIRVRPPALPVSL